MKCPKCGYLGFEEVERCRNCGYDFSFAPAISLPELPIRTDEPRLELLDDLALTDTASAREAKSSFTPDLEKLFGAPLASSDRARGPQTPGGEFPLFGDSQRDDRPLITKASPPRPPLAVRRSTPDLPRLRTPLPRTPMLDLGPPEHIVEKFDNSAENVESRERLSILPASRPDPNHPGEQPFDDEIEPASLGARVAAVAVDLLILAAVDAIVIYFTMKICGLTMADLGIVPKTPLAAFMLVQNGGYLVAFTAGGQTLGKVAAGIRVVAAADNTSLDLGRSVVRTAVWLLLAIPAGLGFVTALFNRDGRGLHDHCAGTRVVRASTA